MSKTFGEVTASQNAFVAQYFGKHGINSVGVSWVKHHVQGAQNPEELCISVGLEQQLDDMSVLPTEHQGCKVFYQVIGKIRALGA